VSESEPLDPILRASLAADLPKLTLKHDDAFLVADRRGDVLGVPGGDVLGVSGAEFGFYADGTRFLQQAELRVHGWRPLLLNATVSDDALEGAIELTNPDILDGTQVILPGQSLRMSRRLVVYQRQLHQVVRVENFAARLYDLVLAWHLGADFVDVFEVRGHRRPRHGTLLPVRADGTALELSYQGLDRVVRITRLEFDPPPHTLEAGSPRYVLSLAPRGRVEITMRVMAHHSGVTPPPSLDWTAAVAGRRDVVNRLQGDAARVVTDHGLFNLWCERARRDLNLLLTETPEGFVPDAGIPWYVAPFGRDSLITALQVLPFEPEIARGTLRFLARHQATEDDAFTDQQPGKILHEYRGGELAACREIPYIPYYGAVDATPLFLMLLSEYVRWTHDLTFLRELWPAAERALAWLLDSDARDAQGFLRYRRRSPVGLENQGWKDSRDAIMHASGELAQPPIALAEVQGYQYAALLGIAGVAPLIGKGAMSTTLRSRANDLRERFERVFWMEDETCYALAVDAAGSCRVVTSNPGHCLWTGIVSADRAPKLARRLMAEDMFTGWGLRTLSAGMPRYNPMSYHNGSVWPHDTALAAAGLRRYGLGDDCVTLTTALFQAVQHFDELRMPELFCGLDRVEGQGPTRFPVACSPQAWSAGVAFHLVHAMLGLRAEAARNRLTLNSPRLPPWLGWMELHGLRLRDSRVAIRVSHGRENAAVELLERTGAAELLVRP
jgi:glycogen debranching enzyme